MDLPDPGRDELFVGGPRLSQGTHFRTSLFGLLNSPQDVPSATPWALYATLLFLVGIGHLVANSDPTSFVIRLPFAFKAVVDRIIASPVAYFHRVDRHFYLGRHVAESGSSSRPSPGRS